MIAASKYLLTKIFSCYFSLVLFIYFSLVYLLCEFDKFWFTERPVDVMQFNAIKEKFQKFIIRKLRRKSCSLLLNNETRSESLVNMKTL